MKKIIAIVVTYNRKELLEENITALLNQSYTDFDILIVDNNSNDGTFDMINNCNTNRIIYINTRANLGGAGGFAVGIKEAIKRDYDYCWVMDDDTIPEKDALKSMINKSEIIGGQFSFINSLIKWKDESMCKMNIPIIDKEWFNQYSIVKHNVLPLSCCSFVSCLINLEIAKKIGLPIKEFFIYGDDMEYTLRLRKEENGYLDFDSIAIHKMTSNQVASIVTSEESRIQRYAFAHKNGFYIAKKRGKKEVIKYILYFFLTFYEILLHAKSKKIKRILILLKGFFGGLSFNPPIIKTYID